jgi:hypothetical protein
MYQFPGMRGKGHIPLNLICIVAGRINAGGKMPGVFLSIFFTECKSE